MREPPSRWALAPLPPDAASAERRRREHEEARLVHRIRWVWNDLWSGVEVPLITHILLGPPTRFSVQLGPGQLREDFVAVRRRLAAAYLVDDVDVRDLVRGWITIELIEHGVHAPRLGPSQGGRELEAHRPSIPPRGRRHWPPRWRGGPFGKPRLDR